MSLAEMRAELKKLRKESKEHHPISRMKKSDISAQIERLRGAREETPAAAAVPSAGKRVSKAAVESIKEAKAKEFPVKPSKGEPKEKAAPPAKKPKMSKADMLKMISEMSSDEE